MKRVIKKLGFVLVFISLIIIFLGVGFSTHTTSPGSQTVNVSLPYLYNITINNSNTGQTGNITQVNITLPLTFTFTANTNGTNTIFVTSTNTSNVLTWSNFSDYLINGSVDNSYFWFNATPSTPGNYNISIVTLNGVTVSQTNLSILVNDTTAPSFVNIPANQTVVYGSQFSYQVNATDNIGLSGFIVNDTRFSINNSGYLINATSLGAALYNINVTINDTSNNKNVTHFGVTVSRAASSIYAYVNNSRTNFSATAAILAKNIWLNGTINTGGGNVSLYLNGSSIIANATTSLSNQTNLTTGYYNLTVYLSGNTNYTSSIDWLWINYTLDTTAPVVNLISPAHLFSVGTSTNIIFSYNVTDLLPVNCSLIMNGNVTNFNSVASIDGATSTFTNMSISAGGSNSWNINCTDLEGNVGNSTVYGFSTVPATIASTSNGGSSTPTEDWASTYSASAQEFAQGFSKDLFAKGRVSVSISGETHYVGVIALSGNSATIEIGSTPQQAVFSVGEEKKFDVNNDGYYDILVRLNSIIAGKASIYIKSISELISQAEPAEVTASPEENLTGEPVVETNKLPILTIIIIAAALVLAVAIIVFLIYRRQNK